MHLPKPKSLQYPVWRGAPVTPSLLPDATIAATEDDLADEILENARKACVRLPPSPLLSAFRTIFVRGIDSAGVFLQAVRYIVASGGIVLSGSRLGKTAPQSSVPRRSLGVFISLQP